MLYAYKLLCKSEETILILFESKGKMKFVTGDIIKSTIVNNGLAFHTGIILVEDEKILIAHNTPMCKNSSGGNVIVETLDDFLADGREIVRRVPTNLSYEHIIASIESVKNVPFHIVDFNCDDFIFYVRTGKKRKSQLRTFEKRISAITRNFQRQYKRSPQ